MKKIIIACLSVLFLISVASAEIVVVSKQGEAAYKTGAQWVPLGAGVALPVGAKVSTGARSSVVISINGHKVTVNQLSMVKIMESSVEKEKSTTRLGLRRGSLRASVSRQEKIKTVFQVATPVATSSVRGTEETVGYGPVKGMYIIVHKNTVVGESPNGGAQHLSGNLRYYHKPGHPRADPFFEDIKEDVFYQIYFGNATPEERHARDFFVGDPHEDQDNRYVQQSGGVRNTTTVSTGSTTNTRIILLWR